VISVDATTRKNERYAAVRGNPYPRIILTKAYRDFVGLVAEEVRRLGVPQIKSLRWALTVYTTWPRLRHLDETKDSSGDFPMGDSDASLSGVKDALQEAGVLADDVRFVSDRTFNLYEKDVRRVVAVLEPTTWDPMTPAAEYTDLLAEVAAARQTPEYRQRTAEHLLAVGVAAAKKAAGKPKGRRAAPAKKPAALKPRASATPRKAPSRS
jgi:Holliday junction resolvase RusA-like endonuclease